MTSGALHGSRVCRGAPAISHLFFADDSITFGRANEREVLTMKQALKVYEDASGRSINLSKSDICFSNGIPEDRVVTLVALLGVNKVDQHYIYLGISTNVGRSKEAIFRVLVDRVEKKIKDWKSRSLSQAGKLTLLKSVVQSIPTYLMGVFYLPNNIIKRIETAMSRFWWGQKHDERRVHWVA